MGWGQMEPDGGHRNQHKKSSADQRRSTTVLYYTILYSLVWCGVCCFLPWSMSSSVRVASLFRLLDRRIGISLGAAAVELERDEHHNGDKPSNNTQHNKHGDDSNSSSGASLSAAEKRNQSESIQAVIEVSRIESSRVESAAHQQASLICLFCSFRVGVHLRW